ncbi:MAG: endonuclease V [Ferroplasma sp.]
MNYSRVNLYSYLQTLLEQIPEREITTYGAIARALGDLRAARAVASMLYSGEIAYNDYLCRIVYSDGTVKNNINLKEKIKLQKSGLEISGNKIANFQNKLFTDFKSDQPLQKLAKEQESLSLIADYNDHNLPEAVAAIDVSYIARTGYGAMVFHKGTETIVKNAVLPVNFPYIPGYLAYRETPFIEELAQEFDGMLLIDANGMLHPRKCGLATFAGIVTGKTTIGVAKSLLMGNIVDNYIYYNSEKLGYAINKHTIVSPGNGISLTSSIKMIKLLGNGKYPELLKAAHNETVKLRKRRLPS